MLASIDILTAVRGRIYLCLLPLLLTGACQFDPPAASPAVPPDAPPAVPPDAPQAVPPDAPPAELLPCADDLPYEANPATGRLYRAFDNAVSFAEARQQCEDDGAFLAVINDEDENEYVFGLLGRDVWIGLTDEETEGTFVWLNGDELAYDNWAEEEPNNSRNREDFTELVDDGTWNDIDSNDPNRFICECAQPAQ